MFERQKENCKEMLASKERSTRYLNILPGPEYSTWDLSTHNIQVHISLVSTLTG